MRENPLYPSVKTYSNKVMPLAELRASLEGGRSSEKARSLVATIWSNSLLPSERGAGYQFYTNALESWLSNKTSNTKRSYAGTLVNFFDFASRRRHGSGDSIRLVAPHELNQSDIDEYVLHLSKPSINPEIVTNRSERIVYEWLLDHLKDKPEVMASIAKSRMSKEGIDTSFPDYIVKKGFRASLKKGFTNFDYIISSLARKLLVSKRHPIEDDPTADPSADYPIGLRSPDLVRQPSTQIQRLQALSSFWSHLLTDKKLGMSRRPGALEPVNPWKDPSRLMAKSAPDNQLRKASRKMSVDDLQKVSNKLAYERLDVKDPGFINLKNILATRDELAVFFYTSTGLRRQEGMMARVENLRDTPIGGGRLLLLSGIRKKGRRSDEEVFVPMYVLKLRQHLYSLMKQYTDETEQYGKWIKEQYEDNSGELKMALMRRGHFQAVFHAALLNSNKGPLIPALGRWGNAVYKAQEKGVVDSVPLASTDLTQVPMDGRNLLHRMQRLARGKEDRKLRYHPHALRHLSVTMAEGVGDGRLAQAIAGHRSASTTDIYRDMVSLQAAAVLKVDEKLQEIFAKAASLAIGQVPVVTDHETSAVEAPEQQEQELSPREAAIKAQEEELRKMDERRLLDMERMEQRIKDIERALSRLVKDAGGVEAIGEIADDLKESIHRARQSREKMVVLPAADKAAPQQEGPIHAIGQDLSKSKGAKKKPPAEQPKIKGAKALAESALASIPPSLWFTDADSWQQGGQFVPPVYLTVEQVENVLASGKIFGPQVVSRYGFSGDAKRKKMSIVTSMRSNLPYIFYFSKATSDGEEESVQFKWNDEMIGAQEAPKLLSKNPSKKTSERPKKERVSIAKPERMIYMPILNVGNASSVDDFSESANSFYNGLRMTDPDKSKAILTWVTILMSMSRRVSKELGDSVKWLGQHEPLWSPGETTLQALARSRMSTFREPTADMMSSFLLVEGTSLYGRLGKSFRLEDEEGRRRVIESRLVANLENAEAFEDGDIGSFLSVYPLPDWITSEDPLGDMPDKDLAELKNWLKQAGSKFSVVGFDHTAKTLHQFWEIVGEFASNQERTVTIPEQLKSEAEEFNRQNQVDLLLGVRRCLRHLWEMKKDGQSGFSFREEVGIKKIDRVWGLYWSWVLPSTQQAKARLSQSGSSLRDDAVKKAINASMVEISAMSLTEPFESSVNAFAKFMVNVMNDPSITQEAAVGMIEAAASRISKEMAAAMFPSNKFDFSTSSEYVLNVSKKYMNSLLSKTDSFDKGDFDGIGSLVEDALRNKSRNKSFSFKDLESIFESDFVDESALIASAAILVAAHTGASNFYASETHQHLDTGDSWKNLPPQTPGEEAGYSVTKGKDASSRSMEDKVQEEFAQLISVAPKSFASSPWVKEKAIEIAKATDRITKKKSPSDREKAAAEHLGPILMEIREKKKQFISSQSPELPSVKAPELPAEGSGDEPAPKKPSGRRMISVRQDPTKAVTYVDAPEAYEPKPEPKGINLLTDPIEPILEGEPGWKDFSENIEDLEEMVYKNIAQAVSGMSVEEKKAFQNVILSANIKVENSRSDRFKADLTLGIYRRVLQIIESKKMRPNMGKGEADDLWEYEPHLIELEEPIRVKSTSRSVESQPQVRTIPPQLSVARSIRINHVNLIRWIYG